MIVECSEGYIVTPSLPWCFIGIGRLGEEAGSLSRLSVSLPCPINVTVVKKFCLHWSLHFQKLAYYLDRAINHPNACLSLYFFVSSNSSDSSLHQNIFWRRPGFLSNRLIVGHHFVDIDFFPSFILYQTHHLVLPIFSMLVSYPQSSQLKRCLYFAL